MMRVRFPLAAPITKDVCCEKEKYEKGTVSAALPAPRCEANRLGVIPLTQRSFRPGSSVGRAAGLYPVEPDKLRAPVRVRPWAPLVWHDDCCKIFLIKRNRSC